MTDSYCVVGKDVSHSPSPAMLNAAFRAAKIDAEYTNVSIPEARFVREFGALMESGTKGMNVTIPFKTLVIPWLGSLDPVALRIHAVNTVKKEGSAYVGHNTDPDGIVAPLKAARAFNEVKTAMLIGAGGAARAFCEAMNRVGILDIGMAVRSVERASGFVEDMEKAFPKVNLTVASMEDLRHLGHDLIFNASPMGAKGEPLPPGLKKAVAGTRIVFDAVYRPRETRLLTEARRQGAEAIPGEEMLLNQGMAAFRLWTGREPPEKPMRKALSEDLVSRRTKR